MEHEEEEEEEELPTPQAEGVYATNAPFINLRDELERQAYTILKDRVFSNTREFDPTLLENIGMDSEFDSIWQALGWEGFVSVQEIGSRPITIQFLCTLQEDASGISFRFHGVPYRVSWKDLSCTLGFHHHCDIPLEQACSGFTHESFWEELSIGLFVARLHYSATISCIPLSDCGTSGSPSLSFQGMMFEPCTLTR
jgi:hypothetical protein